MIEIEVEDFGAMLGNIGGVLDDIDDVTRWIGRRHNYITLDDINLNKEQKEYIDKLLKEIYDQLDYIFEDMEKRVDKYLKEKTNY